IYVDAGYVAFFRKIQPAGNRYAVSSPSLGRVGGRYELSFSIRNNIIFFVKGIYTEDDSKPAGKKDRF
ncbi:hypothetical protein, partial [Neisseria polysaccharea]|uniref:hypothetical protein n=1 Tax=Neisseria polysaccharea TaxID=489 RepID=UPI0019D611EE